MPIIFSSGVGVEAKAETLFIAIADGGVIPTGWSVSTDLAGKYLRGSSIAAIGGTGGAKTHSHIINAETTSVNGNHLHSTSVSLIAALYNAGVSLGDLGSQHNTGFAGDHWHIIGGTVDPAANIPVSRVIDWIGKVLVQEELNAFPVGAILGMSVANPTVPVGWKLADGTGGTPNLLTKFVGKSVGGAASHSHSESRSIPSHADSPGHTHPGTSYGAASPCLSVNSGVSNLATDCVHESAHVPLQNIGNVFSHGHSVTVATDIANNLPPFINIAYIIKTAAASGPGAIASDLFVFSDAGAAPSGWTSTFAFNGKLLVGRKAGDSDFGSFGDVGNASHTHTLSGLTISTAGGHSHVDLGVDILPGTVGIDLGAGASVSSPVHTHTGTTIVDGAHNHPGTVTPGVPGNHSPDSETINDVIKKT